MDSDNRFHEGRVGFEIKTPNSTVKCESRLKIVLLCDDNVAHCAIAR